MHNSTVFCKSNENFLGSLAWDAQVLLNRWQNAADNGYGLGQWWGTATSVALVGFDYFCDSVLRNLVAITVYFSLVALELAQREIASGRAQERLEVAAAVVQVAAIVVEECLSLDGGLCPCVRQTPDWTIGAVEVEPVDDVQVEAQGLIDWSAQRWPQLASVA